MSDQPENPLAENTPGGWHQPRRPNLWQPPEGQAAPEPAKVVPALPQEMSTVPQATGGWHRPDPADTTYADNDEVKVQPRPAAAPAPAAPSPEDMLQNLLSTRRPETPTVAADPVLPEDFVITDAATGEPVRPEDFVIPGLDDDLTVGSDALDDNATLVVDELDSSEFASLSALGELDDASSDEAFNMGEFLALASLQQAAQQDGSMLDPNELGTDDYSPAQRALFNAAARVSQEMNVASDGAELDATDADSIASMADRYGTNELDMSTAALRATDDPDADDPASIAARMAAQFNNEDTGTLAGTQPFPTGQQDLTPQLTPEQRELAEQFRNTRREVQALRQLQQSGQITYQELEQRVREQAFLDNEGNWWNLGGESNNWFRYNEGTGQWEIAEPPVPLDLPSPRTETGVLEPADILAGSLPYLPADGGYDEESSMGTASTVPYGEDEIFSTSPLPNPNQPLNDPNVTVVGSSVDLNTLQTPAVADPNPIFDAGMTSPGNTVPSAGYEVGYDGEFVGEANAAPDYAPSYVDEGQAEDSAYAGVQQREQRRAMNRIALVVVGLIACGLLSLTGVGALVYTRYTGIASEFEAEILALADREVPFQDAIIYDAEGQEIVRLTSGEGSREKVSIEAGEVSPYFIHAIVSSENQSFYEDPGFSPLAAGRAVFDNLTAGEIVSGASTITQQVARNLVLNDTTVTADRKLREIVVSFEISRLYTKNEILDLYINEFFFGNQSYGVESAAQFYFDTSAADLNMAQAAMLAGILPAPSSENPVVNREAAFANMRNAIDDMINVDCLNFQHGQWVGDAEFCINESSFVDDGSGGGNVRLFERRPNGFGGILSLWIAEVEAESYQTRDDNIQYPHFVNFVVGQIEATYGQNALFERGFQIYTTLIPRLQNRAEAELAAQVERLNPSGVNTGAVLIANPTGEIRALVGSPDFNNAEIDGQVDNTRTFQQPGSTIKPITFAAAFEGGDTGYFTPSTILWDVPTVFNLEGGGQYEPVNFDGRYRGAVPARDALQQSLNVPAVKAFQFIGGPAFRDMSNRLGIQYLDNAVFGPAAALGSNDVTLFDMVEAYGTFAADGINTPLFAITRIDETIDGSEFEIAFQRSESTQVITPQVAYLMQNILSDDGARVPQFGANGPMSGAALGIPNQGYVAAKTGTSDGGRDLWTVGFTNNWVVGVWVGTFNNAETTGNLTGNTAAAPLWNLMMAEALTGDPGEFVRAQNIIVDTVCRLTGTQVDETCPNPATDIWISGLNPPPANQGFAQTVLVDSWTNRLANDFCPGFQIQQAFANINDQAAISWLNTTNEGQQIVRQLGLPANLQPPPTEECQQGQFLPSLNIVAPAPNATISETITITGQVSAESLQNWQLQIAPVNTTNFVAVTEGRSDQVQQNGAELGTWDSTTVDNGAYTLRLIAFSTFGGFAQRDVQININNIPPTPTPVPTALPTTIPLVPSPIGGEPLPFEPIDSQGAPAPTPTLDPFG